MKLLFAFVYKQTSKDILYSINFPLEFKSPIFPIIYIILKNNIMLRNI